MIYNKYGDFIMRIYYIFKINEDMLNITKRDPEKLYETLESIYMLDEKNLSLGLDLYKKLTKKIRREDVNLLLKDIYRDNINYNNYSNVHTYNDYLRGEESKIFINNSYIKIKTNVNYPIFLNDIKNIKNIFVCDFINLDYFWLKEITTSLV